LTLVGHIKKPAAIADVMPSEHAVPLTADWEAEFRARDLAYRKTESAENDINADVRGLVDGRKQDLPLQTRARVPRLVQTH
jgi:hypothetical protein